MLLLEKVLEEVPEREKTKYSVDTVSLFRALKEREVDIPNGIYYKREEDNLIGSAISYMEEIEGISIIGVEKSYDLIGRLTHDFHCLMGETEDAFYVAVQINKGAEIRAHSYETRRNNSYTDAFLLKFEGLEEFYELLDEIALETQTSEVVVDDRSYLVTPKIDNEDLMVRDKDTGEEIYGIRATNDEEFTDRIRKVNEVKKLMLVINNRINDKKSTI